MKSLSLKIFLLICVFVATVIWYDYDKKSAMCRKAGGHLVMYGNWVCVEDVADE